MKNIFRLTIILVVITSLLAFILACATSRSQARTEESWTSTKTLKFDDIVYFAANDELERKSIPRDEVLKEFLFTYMPMAKEYEARLITKHDIDGYLNSIQQKILEYNKTTAGYKNKTYHFITYMKVGPYSPEESGFLMFNKFDDYVDCTMNNPHSRSHDIPSRQNVGKGSSYAGFKFQPFFKLPLDQESATKAIISKFPIKENMTVPVLFEYSVDHCNIITGNRSRNGSSCCVIKIMKASVFENSNRGHYTKLINLVPVDRSAASKVIP